MTDRPPHNPAPLGAHAAASARGHAHTIGNPSSRGRVDWIDYVKGFCIILVVQLHVAVALEQDLAPIGAGLMGVDWRVHEWGTWFASILEPFRMPLFFLVSGLFLARTIDRPWRTYLDNKVLHFAYFYILWLTITFALKYGAISGGDVGTWLTEYAFAFVQPFGPLWFLYMLAIFFVATRLLAGVVPLAVIWVAAAALHVPHIDTGAKLIDEFASRYVFFVTGYIFAERVFAFARAAEGKALWSIAAVVSMLAASVAVLLLGSVSAPGVTLVLGFAGCAALIALFANLAAWNAAPWLAFCGRHSIVIYLAAFIPAGAARAIGIKLLPSHEATVLALQVGVVVAGVIGALVMWWIAQRTPARILFERPAWARLSPAGQRSAFDGQLPVGESRAELTP
ncbi:MAG: acyltransferase family protein [Pseudomonadota bacterium]